MKKILISFILVSALMLGMAVQASASYIQSSFGTAKNDGSQVFVLNRTAGSLVIYNRSGAGVASIALPGVPFEAVLSHDQAKLYVSMTSASAGGFIKIYTLGVTGSPIAETTINMGAGSDPAGLALTTDGKTLYVADRSKRLIDVYDVTSTPSLLKTISMSGAANLYKLKLISTGILTSDIDTVLFVTNNTATGELYSINTKATSPAATLRASGLANPSNIEATDLPQSQTYGAAANVSKLLFVQVYESDLNDPSGNHNDVVVFNATNGAAVSQIGAISIYNQLKTADFSNALHGTYSQDELEAIRLTGNGQFLYITHYLPNNGKMLYVAYPVNDDTSVWSSKKIKVSTEVGTSGSIKDQLIPLYDGSALIIANSLTASVKYFEAPPSQIGTTDQMPVPTIYAMASENKAALFWTFNQYATNYELTYNVKGSTQSTTITTKDAALFLDNLQWGTTYEAIVRAQAINPNGSYIYGPYSNKVQWTTDPLAVTETKTEVKTKVLLYAMYDQPTGKQNAAKVYLEARSAYSTVVATSAAMTLDQTGSGTAEFTNLPDGSYYIVAKQFTGSTMGSNHLSIMTAAPVSLTANQAANLDFSNVNTALYQAAGATAPAVVIAGKQFMIPGDVNGDGYVNSIDYFAWLAASGSTAGDASYTQETDMDQNNYINSVDYSYWLMGSGFNSSVSK